MKLPTNAAEWDKECERIVRAMQAYAPNSQSFDRLLAFVEREDARIRTIESRLSALERA